MDTYIDFIFTNIRGKFRILLKLVLRRGSEMNSSDIILYFMSPSRLKRSWS